VTPVVVLVAPLTIVGAFCPEGRDTSLRSAEAGPSPLSFKGVLKLVAEGVGISTVQALVITALAVDSEGLGLVPQFGILLGFAEWFSSSGSGCGGRSGRGGGSCSGRSGRCSGLDNFQKIKKRLRSTIVPAV